MISTHLVTMFVIAVPSDAKKKKNLVADIRFVCDSGPIMVCWNCYSVQMYNIPASDIWHSMLGRISFSRNRASVIFCFTERRKINLWIFRRWFFFCHCWGRADCQFHSLRTGYIRDLADSINKMFMSVWDHIDFLHLASLKGFQHCNDRIFIGAKLTFTTINKSHTQTISIRYAFSIQPKQLANECVSILSRFFVSLSKFSVHSSFVLVQTLTLIWLKNYRKR